jgi:hypothetical protein
MEPHMGIEQYFANLFHHNDPATPAAPVALPPLSDTPMSTGRVLLIHGYSDSWKGFVPWHNALKAGGVDTVPIAVGNYVTLNNEVTIKDLGEAFDRALLHTPWSSGTRDDTFTFDAIVHSTGMLVLRQWLTSDPYRGITDAEGKPDSRSRIARLKHLVGLAPATFGSPQAKEGRSWLGALIKGNKDPGPDFLNAGDQVLLGLELASKYTWDLAHMDMLSQPPLYDRGSSTPYVTVFIGNTGYTGIAAAANSPGSDGTVRWAGCALNTRKVSLDLRRTPMLKDANGQPLKDAAGQPARCQITPWAAGRLAAPMIAVDGKNHGTLLAEPDEEVRDFIVRFLHLSDAQDYLDWEAAAVNFGQKSLAKMNLESTDGKAGGAGWQQLIVHMVDDHGDGVPDFNFRLFIGDDLSQSDNPSFPSVDLIADAYSADTSYRCFYIRVYPDMLALNSPGTPQKKMWIELIASSGSKLIEYEAYNAENSAPKSLTVDHDGGSPVKMDITALAQGDQSLLYPYTTTLLEVFVEREPTPLGTVSTIFTFPDQS